MRTVVFIACLTAALGAARGQSAPQVGASPRRTLEIVLPSHTTATALGRIEEYLWNESKLGPRFAGLLALITAREMSLPYEWSVREDAALQAGLEPAVVECGEPNVCQGRLAVWSAGGRGAVCLQRARPD